MKKYLGLLLFVLSFSVFSQSKTEDVSTNFDFNSKSACFRPCDKKGLESKNCKKCLVEKEGLKLALDDGSLTAESPCFNSCSKHSTAINSCVFCLNKYYGIKKNSELSDCDKSDDGQKISCPDGEYFKSSSVSDSQLNQKLERSDSPTKGAENRVPSKSKQE